MAINTDIRRDEPKDTGAESGRRAELNRQTSSPRSTSSQRLADDEATLRPRASSNLRSPTTILSISLILLISIPTLHPSSHLRRLLPSSLLRPSFLPSALPVPLSSSPYPEQTCKPLPDSPDWPRKSAWQALNTSLSGRLLSPPPPGAVCHPSWPSHHSPEACERLASRWPDAGFHSSDTLSVAYNDDTCLPDPSTPCYREGYPAYAVEVRGWEDVRIVMDFARESGVRVVAKGTGHDFLGRSSGPGSLLVNTRRLRGVEYIEGERRAVALGGIGAIRVYAGERMSELYAFAAERDITVVLGAEPDVGIGGWVSGGGHSPVSSSYGLGADQVIEMEVVTADGELRTIDAERDADLFWALRGGGAGTYAVLISVTMKAYPRISTTALLFSFNTTARSDTFWSMMAYFHSQIPRLSEAGLMGYYYALPQSRTEKNVSIAGQLFGLLLGPTLTSSQVEPIVAPLQEHILSARWGDAIYAAHVAEEHPRFSSFWRNHTAQSVGIPVRLGSRLLTNSSLLGGSAQLKDALRQSTPAPWDMMGNIVAGPGVRSPPGGVAGNENAVLPAWRETYTHLILPRAWPQLDAEARERLTTQLRDVNVEALRQLSPDSGAYANEADPTEPDWQQTFYGSNYPRLLDVKKKWDPLGVFWCKACVGSELWSAKGPNGVESGVGQDRVHLCRT